MSLEPAEHDGEPPETRLERWARRLRHARAWLRAPFNAAAFSLRRRLAWRRGVPPLVNESKQGLFAEFDPAQRGRAERREAALRARYRLEPLRAASSRLTYRLNLYLLDVLEGAGPELDPWLSARERLRVIDIGSKDFAYATALERFFRWRGSERGRELELDGVELDGYVVYRDLYSRADHAHAHAARLGPHVRYHVMDIRAWAGAPADAITWFYPFLSPYPLLRWGLPLRHYRPGALVRCALGRLREGGLLITLHQTREECARFGALLPAALRTRWRQRPARSPLMVNPEVGADRWLTTVRLP